MNGHLLQIVALGINGNALRSGFAINGFWPNGGAFIFDHETSFYVAERRGHKEKWVRTSADPISWLTLNAAKYRIHSRSRLDPNVSDHRTSGFTNGGPRWMIEAVHEQTSSLWEGVMEVSHPNAVDKKIWTTRYYRIELDQPVLPTGTMDLKGERDRLHRALDDILSFSQRQKLGFSERFAKALSELNSTVPSVFSWSKGILPAGFEMSLAARQIFACAQHGYVFGGMGSWDDVYWSESEIEAGIEAEYGQVSAQLFTCLNDAVAAATNSTFAEG